MSLVHASIDLVSFLNQALVTWRWLAKVVSVGKVSVDSMSPHFIADQPRPVNIAAGQRTGSHKAFLDQSQNWR
jgi:hypothetical protein